MSELTPPSMHSPVLSFDQQAKQSYIQQRNFFPTPQPEPATMEPTARGLGIYECPMPQAQSTVQDLPPSPSDSWSHSSVMESQEFPATSQQAPDISSAAFDPFSSYHHMNSTLMTSSSPEAPALVFCQSPPSSTMPSHRNSVSSECSPSDSYSQQGFYTPRQVKTEDNHEWYPTPGNDAVLQRRLTTQNLTPYSNGVSPIQVSTEDPYKSAPVYSSEFPSFADEPRASYDASHVVPSVSRVTKRKRQRTTAEEATHECRVCGKLFKRSYNWKSHMETHNPERKYPHPCTAMVGSQQCSKKFQRKTDLDRHYDSVHRKLRNHRCNLCGNSFARRDTLRRHTEDGCTKRFELGFRDGSAATTPGPQRWSPLDNFMPKRAASLSSGMPQPSGPLATPISANPSRTPYVGFERSPFASSSMQAPAIYAS